MSFSEKLKAHLVLLLEPVVEDYGFELVELQFRRESSGWVLRLLVDSPKGVGVEDCARISRESSRILEVEDPIEQAYQLEVSSPGLDRPLKNERDFIRCRGKMARVVCREAIEEETVFVGELGELKDGAIELKREEGDITIPFAAIRRARLVF